MGKIKRNFAFKGIFNFRPFEVNQAYRSMIDISSINKVSLSLVRYVLPYSTLYNLPFFSLSLSSYNPLVYNINSSSITFAQLNSLASCHLLIDYTSLIHVDMYQKRRVYNSTLISQSLFFTRRFFICRALCNDNLSDKNFDTF